MSFAQHPNFSGSVGLNEHNTELKKRKYRELIYIVLLFRCKLTRTIILYPFIFAFMQLEKDEGVSVDVKLKRMQVIAEWAEKLH